MAAPQKKVSCYSLLGLRAGAVTDEDVRTAYKKAVMTAHPDKPGGSAQQFRLVQDAYQRLGTAEKRRKYNDSLKEDRKLRTFAMIRPKALPAVKKGHVHQLMDGSFYEFETAPEKMRCRYRHGDVVQGPTGCCGVVVGLAADGIYWVKDDHPYATLLFCPDFGGNADIHLIHREKKAREVSAAPPKPDFVRRDSMREQALRNLVEREREAREHLEAAVQYYFNDCRQSLDKWAQAFPRPAPAVGGGQPSRAAATADAPRVRPISLIWRRREEPIAPVQQRQEPDVNAPAPTAAPSSASPSSIHRRMFVPSDLSKTVPLISIPRAGEAENREPTPRNRVGCRSSSLSRGTRSTGLAETTANASSRSSSAGASARGTLSARRSDLQRVLDEAKALRHQGQETPTETMHHCT